MAASGKAFMHSACKSANERSGFGGDGLLALAVDFEK
jgi:hypothetical protein